MSDEPWHFDKRIPIALIITLFLQSSAAVWWASNISGDVGNLQTRQDKQEKIIETMRATSGAQAVQLGRIEENTRATAEAIARLSRLIEGGK